MKNGKEWYENTLGFGSVSSLLRFDFGSAAVLPLGYRRLYFYEMHRLSKEFSLLLP